MFKLLHSQHSLAHVCTVHSAMRSARVRFHIVHIIVYCIVQTAQQRMPAFNFVLFSFLFLVCVRAAISLPCLPFSKLFIIVLFCVCVCILLWLIGAARVFFVAWWYCWRCSCLAVFGLIFRHCGCGYCFSLVPCQFILFSIGLQEAMVAADVCVLARWCMHDSLSLCFSRFDFISTFTVFYEHIKYELKIYTHAFVCKSCFSRNFNISRNESDIFRCHNMCVYVFCTHKNTLSNTLPQHNILHTSIGVCMFYNESVQSIHQFSIQHFSFLLQKICICLFACVVYAMRISFDDFWLFCPFRLVLICIYLYLQCLYLHTYMNSDILYSECKKLKAQQLKRIWICYLYADKLIDSAFGSFFFTHISMFVQNVLLAHPCICESCLQVLRPCILTAKITTRYFWGIWLFRKEISHYSLSNRELFHGNGLKCVNAVWLNAMANTLWGPLTWVCWNFVLYNT